MDIKWWQKAVVYQIYPRSFKDMTGNGIGDLTGIMEKLDYLQFLGIDAIWLSPVYRSAMIDNGYDISDYYEIDPLFGRMSDFERLMTLAKSKDIKIIMDLVVNHTSDQHKWFQESRKSLQNPYRNFYIWRELPGAEPNQWTYDEKSRQYYFHLFSPEQPDLNWENPRVREEAKAIINFWLQKGVAGFRLDVIDLIGKKPDEGITVNGPELHEYIRELGFDSELLTVGEAWSSSPELAKLYTSPKNHELSMVFGFWHILTSAQNGDKWQYHPLDVSKLKKALSAWQEISPEAQEGWNALFFENHDLPRILSYWGEEAGDLREKSAKALAIVLHFLRGTPFIYQGEEIALTNYPFTSLTQFQDVESREYIKERRLRGDSDELILSVLQKMSRDNARTPMQWNAEMNAGFSTGQAWLKVNPNYRQVNVELSLKNPNSIFYLYQTLIRLRHEEEWLTLASYHLLDSKDPVMAYERRWQNQTHLILANLSPQRSEYVLQQEAQAVLLANSNFDAVSFKAKDKIVLQAWDALVLEIKTH